MPQPEQGRDSTVIETEVTHTPFWRTIPGSTRVRDRGVSWITVICHRDLWTLPQNGSTFGTVPTPVQA